MYLIDTNVISEARKRSKANPGVVAFFETVAASDAPMFLSAISLGELRRGVELIRRRGDADQAHRLEAWLATVVEFVWRTHSRFRCRRDAGLGLSASP